MLKLLTRDNSVALETRRATLRPTSYNADAGTIEAIIATTHPVQRADTRGAFNEVLDVSAADLSAMAGVQVLNGHRQNGGVEAILGVTEAAWVEGDTIVARLRLSERPENASIVTAIRSGEINAVSIGYQVSKWRETTDGDGTRTRTAISWTIREISFVPVPADPHARTRGGDNATIRYLGRRAGVEQRTIDALIDRGASLEEARSAILDDMLVRSATIIRSSHNEHTMDNSEAFVRAVGGALYARADVSYQPAGAERQYVGHSLTDVAREVLRRSGISTVGFAATTLIERAMSTSDFPLILADTVGRTLRASYSQPASGIRQIARQTTANDFRAKTRLMLDSTGVTLEKVGENGEFKSGSLVEAKESYKLATFGRILSFTRQSIINDDLAAFTDIARRLGQAAQAFEAQELVDLLQSNSGVGPTMNDGNALHHTAHGNISASGAAPDETTLSAARLAMRKQTGVGGGLIAVTPRFLLVPSDLETKVEKLLTAIQAMTTDDVNPFSKLVPVVEPRLTSATRWWLVASPSEVDGLEYAHLAGSPGPQTESRTGFHVDGVETKVRLDFGAGFVDWRGWYTNAGA